MKHENHTPTGAFKARRASSAMDRLKLREPGIAGVITATRGNHSQSIAFSSARARHPRDDLRAVWKFTRSELFDGGVRRERWSEFGGDRRGQATKRIDSRRREGAVTPSFPHDQGQKVRRVARSSSSTP